MLWRASGGGCCHMSCATRVSDPSSDAGTQSAVRARAMVLIPQVLLFRRFWTVFRPFVGSSAAGRILCIAVISLCLLSAAMNIAISYMNRDFFSAITSKDEAAFYKGLRNFVLVIILAVPVDAYFGYVQQMLSLRWRVWLTDHLLDRYLDDNAGKAYYQLSGGQSVASDHANESVDNPDQRICEDVNNFTSGAVVLCIKLLEQCLNMVGFAGVLWSIAPDLVFFIFFYAAFGTAVSVCIFGRPIVLLNQSRLAREADLRFALVRLRENAESVAFYQAGRSSRREIGNRMTTLVHTVVELIVWRRNLNVFQTGFHYATIIVPSMILAPRYFAGDIEFGVISQGSMAFSSILAGLSFVVNKFDTLSGLVAESTRLHQLLDALQVADSCRGTTSKKMSAKIASERVALLDPDVDAEMGHMAGTETAATVPPSAQSISATGKSDVVLRVAGAIHHVLAVFLRRELTLETPAIAGATRTQIRLCSGLTFELAAGDALLVCGYRPPLLHISWQHKPHVQFANLFATALANRMRALENRSLDRQDVENLLYFDFLLVYGSRRQELLLFHNNGKVEKVAACIFCPSSPMFVSQQNTGHTLVIARTDQGLHCFTNLARTPSTAYPALLQQSTLRSQLFWPDDAPDGQSQTEVERVTQILSLTRLQAVAKRVGGLDSHHDDWAATLSLGEQQRLALARLLLHNPDIAFLDEATSGLDLPTERQIYSTLRSTTNDCRLARSDVPLTVVSVGHRLDSLLPWHTHVLSFEPHKHRSGQPSESAIVPTMESGEWIYQTASAFSEKLSLDHR